MKLFTPGYYFNYVLINIQLYTFRMKIYVKSNTLVKLRYEVITVLVNNC